MKRAECKNENDSSPALLSHCFPSGTVLQPLRTGNEQLYKGLTLDD